MFKFQVFYTNIQNAVKNCNVLICKLLFFITENEIISNQSTSTNLEFYIDVGRQFLWFPEMRKRNYRITLLFVCPPVGRVIKLKFVSIPKYNVCAIKNSYSLVNSFVIFKPLS